MGLDSLRFCSGEMSNLIQGPGVAYVRQSLDHCEHHTHLYRLRYLLCTFLTRIPEMVTMMAAVLLHAAMPIKLVDSSRPEYCF